MCWCERLSTHCWGHFTIKLPYLIDHKMEEKILGLEGFTNYVWGDPSPPKSSCTGCSLVGYCTDWSVEWCYRQHCSFMSSVEKKTIVATRKCKGDVVACYRYHCSFIMRLGKVRGLGGQGWGGGGETNSSTGLGRQQCTVDRLFLLW